ncbi:MAG TPA: ABC transporter ATP-binding protein [Spirochaetota bacterium]|nr:ABC transporter ATP-binding protein [Spirochaetota bacterium]HOM38511.1 ABC transporter ATP-binding protein [Spirochaetota bacterium]HPQ49051.1 ABC transporter ATP-binding protein [Spirochaetota bacterium]
MRKIEINKLYKSYIWGEEKIEVIKGISMTFEENRFYSIVGESGSGKTTLLNLIGGLDNPDSGSVMIDGKDITSMSDEEKAIFRNNKLGFVFQFYNLLKDFTLIENVMLPYYIKTGNKKEAIKNAYNTLEMFSLEKKANYYPHLLSGGEQQRGAIARAIINQPEIILADEPTGNLDKENKKIVMGILLNLRKKYNLTLIIVTHDIEIAKMSDSIIKLNYGKIEL